MNKHTQGPWLIEEDDYGDEHWFGGFDCGQITVNGWVNGGVKKDPDEWQQLLADARLIAAAPELLEALIEVTATLSWLAHGECRALHDGPIMPSSMAVKTAKAAIAKAKGEVI